MDKIDPKLGNELIAMGKRLVKEGLVAGTGGNISIRVPESNQVIITPSGMAYETIQLEDLVVLDLEGNVVVGNRRPSIERGLHLLVYKQRPEVDAVVHTHSLYASAVAATRQAIPPILDAIVDVVGGAIDCAQYAPHGTQELAENCVAALGQKAAVLLANHGVVGVGKSLSAAYLAAQTAENAAKVYLLSHLIGKPVALSEEVVQYEKEFMQTKYGQTVSEK